MKELQLGRIKTKELAAWFGIAPNTFSNSRAKKLEELEKYCKFNDLGGTKGIDIIEIYVPCYVSSKTAERVKNNFLRVWNSYGNNINTCKNVAKIMYSEEDYDIKFTSLYNGVKKVKTEWYGHNNGAQGLRGNSKWVLMIYDAEMDIYRQFNEEENELRKHIYDEYRQEKEELDERICALEKNKENFTKSEYDGYLNQIYKEIKDVNMRRFDQLQEAIGAKLVYQTYIEDNAILV